MIGIVSGLVIAVGVVGVCHGMYQIGRLSEHIRVNKRVFGAWNAHHRAMLDSGEWYEQREQYDGSVAAYGRAWDAFTGEGAP